MRVCDPGHSVRSGNPYLSRFKKSRRLKFFVKGFRVKYAAAAMSALRAVSCDVVKVRHQLTFLVFCNAAHGYWHSRSGVSTVRKHGHSLTNITRRYQPQSQSLQKSRQMPRQQTHAKWRLRISFLPLYKRSHLSCRVIHPQPSAPSQGRA